MNKYLTALSVLLMIATPVVTQATPDEDLKNFRAYFTDKFKDVPVDDFINGVYSVDAASREQWEQYEEFPAYEIYISKGEDIFHKKFANGKGFADCFPDYEKGIRQNYPHVDETSGKVVTASTISVTSTPRLRTIPCIPTGPLSVRVVTPAAAPKSIRGKSYRCRMGLSYPDIDFLLIL